MWRSIRSSSSLLRFTRASSSMTTPRIASSLVVVKPVKAGEAGAFDYKILMLKRHSKSSTFENAYVFPGGALDAADKDPQWDGLLGPASEGDQLGRALKLAALRETFEESGLLIGRGHTGRTREYLSEWREKVHSDATQYLRLFNSSFLPAVDFTTYLSNWITPPTQKRRFDTHFFLHVLSDSVDVATSDGSETVDAVWLTPQEGIDLCLSNQIVLIPPQLYLLTELSQTQRWAALLDDTGAPRSRKVISFNPVASKIGSTLIMTYEGDHLHPRTRKLFPDIEFDDTYVNRTFMTPRNADPLVNKRPGNELALEGIRRHNMTKVLGQGYPDLEVLGPRLLQQKL